MLREIVHTYYGSNVSWCVNHMYWPHYYAALTVSVYALYVVSVLLFLEETAYYHIVLTCVYILCIISLITIMNFCRSKHDLWHKCVITLINN